MHQREILDRLKNAIEVSGDAELWDLVRDLEKSVHQTQKIVNIHESKKPIICVDFDGVIHSYKSGWKGVNKIPDPPNVDALIWLSSLTPQFDVRIFSARCNDTAGIAAMIEWFRKWGLPDAILSQLKFEAGKPSAFLVIDDRAVTFDGNFDNLSPGALAHFKPWYYAHPEWKR